MCMYSYCYVCSVLCVLFHCIVLCIVCVYMCTVLMPPGSYPIAVNKYINMSVCLSVRTEKLGSHWTDFHEMLYSIILRKFVEKIHV